MKQDWQLPGKLCLDDEVVVLGSELEVNGDDGVEYWYFEGSQLRSYLSPDDLLLRLI